MCNSGCNSQRINVIKSTSLLQGRQAWHEPWSLVLVWMFIENSISTNGHHTTEDLPYQRGITKSHKSFILASIAYGPVPRTLCWCNYSDSNTILLFGFKLTCCNMPERARHQITIGTSLINARPSVQMFSACTLLSSITEKSFFTDHWEVEPRCYSNKNASL